MYPLNRLPELVREGDELALVFSATKEGGTRVVISPRVRDAEQGAKDKDQQAALASLARPLVITVGQDEAIETALNEALDRITESRRQLVAACTDYAAAAAEAAAAAALMQKAATKKRAEAQKKAPAAAVGKTSAPKTGAATPAASAALPAAPRAADATDAGVSTTAGAAAPQAAPTKDTLSLW